MQGKRREMAASSVLLVLLLLTGDVVAKSRFNRCYDQCMAGCTSGGEDCEYVCYFKCIKSPAQGHSKPQTPRTNELETHLHHH
ncbi:unnamed protein product [Linum trigynum]|uniref:Uncharacterized protein n=1 Tax=Linum trigynum TaxID=586398 RepID=A0AAV2GIQ9_9ROSI